MAKNKSRQGQRPENLIRRYAENRLITYFLLQEQELYLYDPSLLLKLDFTRSPTKFNPMVTAVAPGEPWLLVRPLKSGDYRRGFMQSLSQLTNVGEVSEMQFLSKFSKQYPS